LNLKKQNYIKKEVTTKHSKKQPMEKLPYEIICHVGNFLGVEKVSLSLTCKRLNQALKADVEKIKKKLLDFKNKVKYDVVRLMRNNNEKTIIAMRSTDFVISKFLELDLPEEEYVLKHMSKLLEVEPEIVYYDKKYGRHKFTYKDAGSLLSWLIDLIPDTIYFDEAKDAAVSRLIDLMENYECTSKNFEELMYDLRYLFSNLMPTLDDLL
jgi:hypothetical protein